MICAFHFASINKQLICRDFNFIQTESQKLKSDLTLNGGLLNGIFIVQLESPNVIKSQLGFADHCCPKMWAFNNTKLAQLPLVYLVRR